MLEEPAQGPGPVEGIVTVVDDIALGGGGENHLQLLVGQALVQAADEQVHNGGDVLLGQGLVADDLIQAVEELRPEGFLQQLVHLEFGLVGDLPLCVDALQQVLGPQVGGEDEDGVLKVHRPPLAVGDPTVVQDLEEDVEHVGVGLLHLVKEDHGVGFAPHRLGELSPLLIAHVAGGRSDEPGDGEFLHVLRHVDPHQVALGVKQGLGQGFGQLGLAHAGGPQEEEGADGLVGVGDARPAAEDGLGDQAYRLVLAHHPLVEDVLQVEELFPLPFHELGYGDAGPALDDPGDLLLGDLVPEQGAGLAVGGNLLLGLQGLFQSGDLAVLELGGLVQVVLPLGLFQLGVGAFQVGPQLLDLADGLFFVVPLGFLGLEFLPHVRQFLLDFRQMFLGQTVGLLFQGGLFDLVLDDLPLDHIQLGGHGVNLRADEGAGLVDEVDGLVREEPVGDIPVGQGGRGDDGAVLDFHPVEDLIPLFQTSKDGNGVLHRGFAHHHRLEPPLQGGVLFNVLPVLVEGGGADAVELSPGQHGL